MVGIRVGEHRVRLRLNACFPESAENRLRFVNSRLTRRVYWAPHTDFAWHSDMNWKLVELQIGWSGCVDGRSRTVVWLGPTTDKRTGTVFTKFFLPAVTVRGFPDVFVTDMGTENALPADACWQVQLRYVLSY
jgi:hypothetical protein